MHENHLLFPLINNERRSFPEWDAISYTALRSNWRGKISEYPYEYPAVAGTRFRSATAMNSMDYFALLFYTHLT